jgi:hypothetical protein
VSLPTPTGNSLPFGPDHPLFNWPANRQWIAREAREGETVEHTLDRMAAQLSTHYPGFPAFEWRTQRLPAHWMDP